VKLLGLDTVGHGDRKIAGGKAAVLGELSRLGHPVPPGFVISSEAYRRHIELWGLNQLLEPLIRNRSWAQVEEAARNLILEGDLEDGLSEALHQAWHEFGCSAVAVRSSATAEDLDDASFAGQYESTLNVTDEKQFLLAIRNCWASVWSVHALDYRHRRAVDHLTVRMAVVVQHMVPVDAAGVLFTVDPVEDRDDRLLIQVSTDDSEAVTAGRGLAGGCTVDRESLRVIRRDGDTCLALEAHLPELCRLGLDLETHFGTPQDVEFAVGGDHIHLLQSRPMTTPAEPAPEPLEPLRKPSVLDKAMHPLAAERYTASPRPLDNMVFHLMVGAALAVARDHGLRVDPDDLAAFHGRLWHQAYRFPRVHGMGRAVLKGIGASFRLLRTDWMKWWMEGPRAQLQAACDTSALSTLTDEELLEVADRILAAWEQPLNRRFIAATAYEAEPWLERLIIPAVGFGDRKAVLADLMAGLEHPTMEMNRQLWNVSRHVHRDPQVLAAVRDLDLEALDSLPEGRAVVEAMDAFLETWGQREGSCWYLSTPTWRQDPMQVWRMLASLAMADSRPGGVEEGRARFEKARDRVAHGLRFYPGLSRLFHWLLERLRALHCFREQSHFDLAGPLDALQRIARLWGARLVERDLLEAEDDVFYLTRDDVRSWLLESPPAVAEARELIARRRVTWREVNSRWQEWRTPPAPDVPVITGVGVSAGRVRAGVRVIMNENWFHRLRPGEVLVCPHTSPSWTPLFNNAAAVVSETGGPASHAAIVAREYGIPAVMAAAGATSLLEDGREVLVDGKRGTIER